MAMNCEVCGQPMFISSGWHTYYGVPIDTTTTVHVCPNGHVYAETEVEG